MLGAHLDKSRVCGADSKHFFICASVISVGLGEQGDGVVVG